MTSKKTVILSLDMSTTCTGYAVFEKMDTQINLLESGYIKPKVPGISKLQYPKKQLLVCRDMAEKIIEIYRRLSQECEEVVAVVIEEVNAHKNRLSGKTLDGLHFIFWDRFESELGKVHYMDSDGLTGWRTRLRLRLNDADKQHNREAKKLNKKLPRGSKLSKIGQKHLACRQANHLFKKELDCDKHKYDGDEADAICLGYAFAKFVWKT